MLGLNEGQQTMRFVLEMLKIILALLCAEMEAVRLTKLEVPGAVVMGDPVWLHCGYELEDDELYSVKWYKNNIEFYRYLPNDLPPGQKYDLNGVHVSLRNSNGSHVYLQTVELASEGTYGCEVSAEAPSFRTVKAEKELNIYVAPKDSPIIFGAEVWYDVGDYVNVTCETFPSRPPAELNWFINGLEAPNTYKFRHKDIDHKEQMRSTSLTLCFEVSQQHFNMGEMRLHCVASISQVYSRTSEELVIGEKSSAIEPHLVAHLAPGQQAPKINGGLRKYSIGEDLVINCTAPRSKPVANISWFVNEVEPIAEQVTNYGAILEHDDLQTAISGLRLKVRRDDFIGQELRIKCSAAISKVVHVSSDEIVIGGRRESSGLHVSENKQPVRSGTSSCCSVLSSSNCVVFCAILFIILCVHFPARRTS